MILFPTIKGFDCLNQGFQHYVNNDLHLNGWQTENLGESSTVGMDMYGLHRDLSSGKPVIFLLSSVHGNEWQGVFWSRKFCEWISDPSIAQAEVKHIFQYLREKYAWYWIPIANPYGYENLTRLNENGINISVDFEHKTQNETNIIINKFLGLKPSCAVDSHTWDDAQHTPSYTMATYKDGYRDRSFHRQLIKNVIKSLQVILGDKVIEYWYTAHGGTRFRSWAGEQKGIDGEYCISWLTECDRTASNIIQTKEGINALVMFFLQFDAFRTKSIHNPFLSDIL